MTTDFYAGYRRDYSRASLRKRHIRQFDLEFAAPAQFDSSMSVLEIGCGAGLFLQYLEAKGVRDFHGVDQDTRLVECMPETIASHFTAGDLWDFLEGVKGRRVYDRIALFDVFEHFSPEEGVRLLSALKQVLPPDGRVVLRVPNMSSPWGLHYQFNDVTHKSAYNPGSIAQLAGAANFHLVACIAQRHPRRSKEWRQQVLNAVLSWLLVNPPPIWSALMIAVVQPK